jgi:CAAX prenyl protease-like protein
VSLAGHGRRVAGMKPLFQRLASSPALARVVPFAIFLALTFCQGRLGEASHYWLYLAKTVVGAWLVWTMRPLIAELRWVLSWEAVVVGVAVFVVWAGIDDCVKWLGLKESYIRLGKAEHVWNPHHAFGLNSTPAWLFVVTRLAGVTVVVPPLEEVFYRSFLYRYIAKPDFQSVPLGYFAWAPFLLTSVLFGFAHYEWLAGMLCGFAFQGLVCGKKRLGDAITAHAITNFLLGLWVVSRGEWKYW